MRKSSQSTENRWIGAAFILFGVGLFAWTSALPEPRNLGDPGAAFFPRVVAILFVVFASVLVLQPHVPEEESAEGGEATREPPLNLILSAVAAILYIPSLNVLGFILATSVYLSLGMWILSPRRWVNVPVILAISVLFTLGLAFALTRWLGVIPPQGVLF